MNDKVIKIKTLAGEFDKSGLQEYCNSQFIMIKKLKQENSNLQIEIDHLKALLTSTTQLVGDDTDSNIIVPSEQEIIEMQIKLIKERAVKGMIKNIELTLDDIKKLEVLVKTLDMIKERPPEKEKPKGLNISEATLSAIASSENKND